MSENELMEIGKVDNKLQQLGYDEDQLENFNEEQKRELVAMMADELDKTAEGVNLKPVTMKINKDMRKFMDPFDEVLETIKGVVVYKHKTRGYWPKGGDKVPKCSSKDGITGIVTETGEEKKCASCPHNQWGTATDDAGENTSGKACKEMRRLFIDMDNYELPIMLTLPPTSINEFDDYISARMTKSIPDIMRETIVDLNKGESHGYTYAVAEFSIGDAVEPQRIMKLKDQRKMIKETAKAEDITQEDYINDDYNDAAATEETDDNVDNADLDDIA